MIGPVKPYLCLTSVAEVGVVGRASTPWAMVVTRSGLASRSSNTDRRTNSLGTATARAPRTERGSTTRR